jgi:hypothetical protein
MRACESASCLVLVLASVGACGDPSGDAGPDLPEPGAALIERESRSTHVCSVTGEATEVAGSTLGSDIVTTGDSYLVVRTSYEGIDDDYDYRAAVSPVGFDPPALGDPQYSVASGHPIRAPVLVATSDGLAFAWSDTTPTETIQMASLDESGALLRGPIVVGQPDGPVHSIALHAVDGAVVVVWADSALRLVAVDGADSPGDAVTIRMARTDGARIIDTGAGLATIWQEAEPEPAIYLALLGSDGAPRGSPVRLSESPPAGTFPHSPDVIAAGDGLIAAWTEQFFNDDLEDPRGHAIVRVARLDEQGAHVGGIERLQAKEEEILNFAPLVRDVGGTLGLSWSRGTHVAICGGCISDNRRRLLLLDPVDLVPLGDVVEIIGPSGFSTADQAGNGGEIAFVLGVDYHAISNLAVARIHCSATR